MKITREELIEHSKYIITGCMVLAVLLIVVGSLIWFPIVFIIFITLAIAWVIGISYFSSKDSSKYL